MISIRNAAQQESKKQEKRGFRRYQTGWRRLLGSPREERTLAVEGTIGGRPLLGTLISIHRIESNGRKKTHIIIFPFSFVTKKKKKKYKSVIKKERLHKYASASKARARTKKERKSGEFALLSQPLPSSSSSPISSLSPPRPIRRPIFPDGFAVGTAESVFALRWIVARVVLFRCKFFFLFFFYLFWKCFG